MFSLFRKKFNRKVQVYCEGCYQITDQMVDVTKTDITIHCLKCEKDRFYVRSAKAIKKKALPRRKYPELPPGSVIVDVGEAEKE